MKNSDLNEMRQQVKRNPWKEDARNFDEQRASRRKKEANTRTRMEKLFAREGWGR